MSNKQKLELTWIGNGKRPRLELQNLLKNPARQKILRAWIVIRGGLMNREQALALLARSKPTLAARYGVTRLALFGSTARNTARSNSDVDVLVDFDGPATSARYFGMQSIAGWSRMALVRAW